jgi:hypothetical protein
MKKVLSFIGIMLGLITIVGCAAKVPAAPRPIMVTCPVNGLTCGISISTPKASYEYKSDEEIKLELVFKNTGPKDITLYCRDVDVVKNYMEMINSKGEKLPKRWSMRFRDYSDKAVKEHFYPLKSGEILKREITGKIEMPFMQIGPGGSFPPLDKTGLALYFLDEKDSGPYGFQISPNEQAPGELKILIEYKNNKTGKEFGFDNVWTGSISFPTISFSVEEAIKSKE